MELKILSTLIKSINPNETYEWDFLNEKRTMSGIDWIATFIAHKNEITNADGQKLIEHFSTPDKESLPEKKSKSTVKT